MKSLKGNRKETELGKGGQNKLFPGVVNGKEEQTTEEENLVLKDGTACARVLW